MLAVKPVFWQLLSEYTMHYKIKVHQMTEYKIAIIIIIIITFHKSRNIHQNNFILI